MLFSCNGRRDYENAMIAMKICDDFVKLAEDRKNVVCEVVGDLFEQALDDAIYRIMKCPIGEGVCPFDFMDANKKEELHYEYKICYPDFKVVMKLTF